MADPESGAALYEFPLSPTQAALYFIHTMNPTGSAYHVPLAFRLRGELDVEALRQAVDHVVQRHEIFRTTYHWKDDRPVQRVSATGACPVPVHDLSTEDASSRTEQLDALLETQAQAPFDLATGPVARSMLVHLGPNEWVFAWTFHHVAVDSTTLITCVRQLEEAYQAVRAGRAPVIPDEELQYADYVVWREDRDATIDQGARLEPWKRRLSDVAGVLNLPADRPRRPSPSGRGAQHMVSLDRELSRRVREFGRRHRMSLHVVFQAVFTVLLYRYTRQADIVVGTPFANRAGLEELDRIAGCFINTLPLATTLSDDATFAQVLDQVQEVLLEAYETQDLPLEDIVTAVDLPRDPSANPLFQVGCIFQEPPVELQLEGVSATDLHVHSGGAMYDLHLWMWDRADLLSGYLWYNTDIYDTSTVERMAGHLVVLLDGLTAEPERPIAAVPMLTTAEREQLDRWNETAMPVPPDMTFLDLIRDAAAAHPEAVAVEGTSGSLSYRELDTRSDALAGYLLARGFGAGHLIGICVDRSPEMLVGLLGILKAGAAYVPMDPAYPQERLSYMLKTADTPLVVTEAHLVDTVPAGPWKLLSLDTDWPSVEAGHASRTDPLPTVRPEDGAYVIFTSGSTGQPKGVQVPHRTVVNFLLSMAQRPGMQRHDRLLAVTTLSFDIAVLELYLPLTMGATVYVATRDEAADGERLKAIIDERAISIMQATPGTWRLLLSAGWKGATPFAALCGGEAFPKDLAESLLDCGIDVWNMYGPTETTVWSTCHRVHRDTTRDTIPIGTPIHNTQCYVLDDRRSSVPVGIPGELYIGGLGVTDGYLHRTDLTEERFIEHPTGGTVYRTGDLVRFLPDGAIEYLHRVDHQVKVRGFRIEVEEIEAVLLRHDNVAECAVAAVVQSSDDVRLVAYTRFRNGADLTNAELRAHLQAFVPDYMVPQIYVSVDAFPTTPNGKIDRQRLPDPFANMREDVVERSPETSLQKDLAQLWAEAIGSDRIGIDTSFFALGGHSLLLMRVASQIKTRYGCVLPLARLLDRPTIAAWSDLILEQAPDAGNGRDGRSASEHRAPREQFRV